MSLRSVIYRALRSMFRREMAEKMKRGPITASNGRVLTPTLWHGDIPEGWAPLDGRTIEGVTLPDRRSVFLYGTGNKVEPMAEKVPAICVCCEIVREHDLVVDGEVVFPGVLP
jgi:hypothetical protein